MPDTRIPPSPYTCRKVLLNPSCEAQKSVPISDVDGDGQPEAVVMYHCPSVRPLNPFHGLLDQQQPGPTPCIQLSNVLTHNAGSLTSITLPQLTLPGGQVLKPLQGVAIEGRSYLISAVRMNFFSGTFEVELVRNHPNLDQSWDNAFIKACTTYACSTIPSTPIAVKDWEFATLKIEANRYKITEQAVDTDFAGIPHRTITFQLSGNLQDIEIRFLQ